MAHLPEHVRYACTKWGAHKQHVGLGRSHGLIHAHKVMSMNCPSMPSDVRHKLLLGNSC